MSVPCLRTDSDNLNVCSLKIYTYTSYLIHPTKVCQALDTTPRLSGSVAILLRLNLRYSWNTIPKLKGSPTWIWDRCLVAIRRQSSKTLLPHAMAT